MLIIMLISSICVRPSVCLSIPELGILLHRVYEVVVVFNSTQPIDPHAFPPHHIYLQFRPEFVASLISGLCDIVRNCHQVKFVSLGIGTRMPQRDIIVVCQTISTSVCPSIRILVADLVVKVRELMHILCVLSVRLAVCLLICLWFIDNRQRTKLSSGA